MDIGASALRSKRSSKPSLSGHCAATSAGQCKTALIGQDTWETYKQAEMAIFEYINTF